MYLWLNLCLCFILQLVICGCVLYNAAFHWARKLVFTSFPVGNIIPLKSKVVFLSGKLSITARTPTADSEIRVGKYEFPSPMERSISQVKPFDPGYDRHMGTVF